MNTKDMADLIADALLSAKLIQPEDLDQVTEIAEEEIRVRILLGDPIKVESE